MWWYIYLIPALGRQSRLISVGSRPDLSTQSLKEGGGNKRGMGEEGWKATNSELLLQTMKIKFIKHHEKVDLS